MRIRAAWRHQAVGGAGSPEGGEGWEGGLGREEWETGVDQGV